MNSEKLLQTRCQWPKPYFCPLFGTLSQSFVHTGLSDCCSHSWDEWRGIRQTVKSSRKHCSITLKHRPFLAVCAYTDTHRGVYSMCISTHIHSTSPYQETVTDYHSWHIHMTSLVLILYQSSYSCNKTKNEAKKKDKLRISVFLHKNQTNSSRLCL